MNVKNCRNCRRLFNYVMGPILCPACREEMEEKFQIVKKYVQENVRTGIHEVAEACEVDTAQLRQWVREERLIFAEPSLAGIGCEKCGKLIQSGKFCEACKKEMTDGFSQVLKSGAAPAPVKKKTVDKDSPRMRYLDRPDGGR